MTQANDHGKGFFGIALHWQILVALLLAVGIGTVFNGAAIGPQPDGAEANGIATAVYESCKFIGKLFLNALKMIIVPLIVSTIIAGIMNLGGGKDFGRMGLKTLAYYSVSGLLAIIAGLVIVNLLQPGNVAPEVAQELAFLQDEKAGEFMQKVEGRSGGGEMMEIFLRMFPANIVKAAVDGQMLGLITFSMLFGFFISKLPEAQRLTQINLWEGFQGVMMEITNFIIKFAPIGVFGLVTPIVIETGFGLMKPLLLFFLTVVLSLATHAFVTLAIIKKVFVGVNPIKHVQAMAPVLLTAFSTASSSATLPVTLETVQDNSGVSKRVSSFTLPLGATVNMDGTALYECVVVIFIAQVYAVSNPEFALSFGTQFYIVVLALLTSIGVAGIPSASLVAITVILGAVGLPLEAVAMVWLTDRILDMMRTAVNVYSDTCGAVIIAKTEGETLAYEAK